jgi:hypothetical protein
MGLARQKYFTKTTRKAVEAIKRLAFVTAHPRFVPKFRQFVNDLLPRLSVFEPR